MVTTQAQLSPRAAAALGLVFITAGLFILLFALGVAASPSSLASR